MSAITPSQVRVALITDLVDSTRLVAAIGDAAAHEWFGRHDRLARDLLAAHGGLEIDKSDGFLILFADPAQAVGFALAYHQALRQLSVDSHQQWRARVGIQLGELYLRENSADDIAHGAKPLEVEGLAKIVAARLMALAQGGQTLLGHAAFDLAQSGGVTLPGHTLGWLAHGRYRIKGLDDPLAVFEVGVLGEAPLAPPPDSEKAHRDITEDERETLGWRPGPDLEVPGRPHWRLTKKLGAGGFGEVWLAEHAASGARQVFKFCHDPERLRSLKREVTVFRLLREALGDRHDIARIIDWQFDRAPFFIESEYIAGGDLLAWAAAQGGLANAPIDQRIAIAIQLADALGAAHSVGVLHKDIKPGNVLIRADGSGTPHAVLTDFGIGLVTDKTQLLAHGITVAGLTELLAPAATAGSQLYMAPELLEGKAATIQADLYALGVMLYELAAGEFKPLAPGWQRDIDCELLAADIADLVDGDPSRRPSSAAKVARDLRALPERRALLAAERQAVADAAATRMALAKSQRRRRWAAGIAAAMAFVSVAVGFSAVKAVQARDEAELRRAQAERLISFMLDDLRDRLKEVGRLDVMLAVTNAAMNHFEAIPSAQLNDEDLAARSKTLYQIGDTLVSQGDLESAARAMRESLDLATKLAERSPDDTQRQFNLAQSHYWVGYVEFSRRNLDAAMSHFERYREIAERMAALNPSDETWSRELGYSYSNIGTIYERRGEFDKAAELFKLHLPRVQDRARSLPDAQRELAAVNNKIGRLMQKQNRLFEADEFFMQELGILQQLHHDAPDNTEVKFGLANSRYSSAQLLLNLGRVSEAKSSVTDAVTLFDQLARSDPANRRWLRALSASQRLAMQIAHYLGEMERAEEYLANARRSAASTEGMFPDIDAGLRVAEAEFQLALGNKHAAESLASGAIAILSPADANDHLLSELKLKAEFIKARAAMKSGTTLQASVDLLSAMASTDAHANSLDIRAVKARVLLAIGSYDEAKRNMDELAAVGYRHPSLIGDFERYARETRTTRH